MIIFSKRLLRLCALLSLVCMLPGCSMLPSWEKTHPGMLPKSNAIGEEDQVLSEVVGPQVTMQPNGSLFSSAKSELTSKGGESVDYHWGMPVTNFGFALYKPIADKNKTRNRNIAVVPPSLFWTLTALSEGAKGNTQKSILSSLGVRDIPTDYLRSFSRSAQIALTQDASQVDFTALSGVWIDEQQKVKEPFVEIARTNYGLELKPINVYKDTAKTINAWVKSNTLGRGGDIVSQKTISGSKLIMTDVARFHAAWGIPFERTYNELFKPIVGAEVRVSMMQTKGSIPYYQGEGVTAVRIPLGSSARYSMTIMLPDRSRRDRMYSIDAELLRNVWQRLEKRTCTLRMPRFSLDIRQNLTEMLRNNESLKMGSMEQAFEGKADFSAMTSWDVKLDGVYQAVSIVVDETSLEGAPIAMYEGWEAQQQHDVELICNRPFFFAIDEVQSGTVLAMGVVYNPNEGT